MTEKATKSGKFFHSSFLIFVGRKNNHGMFFVAPFQMTLAPKAVWFLMRRWHSTRNSSPASILSRKGRFTALYVEGIWDVHPGMRKTSKCTRFYEWCSAQIVMNSIPVGNSAVEKTAVNCIVDGVGKEGKCIAAPVVRMCSARVVLLRTWTKVSSEISKRTIAGIASVAPLKSSGP